MITPITNKQWMKVLLSLVIGFVAAFGGVWSLTNFAFTKVAVTAALVAGIHAVIVAAYQLFQEEQPIVTVVTTMNGVTQLTPPVTDLAGNEVVDPDAPR